MRQRAALIRTLAVNPDILLLDEAFSALDYQTRLTVVDEVWSILKKENKTALIVTHDIAQDIPVSDHGVIRPCDRTYAKYISNYSADPDFSSLHARKGGYIKF